MLTLLVAALDQTIVGTAMPRIIAELSGFDRYPWVTTSYLLTSTIVVPIASRTHWLRDVRRTRVPQTDFQEWIRFDLAYVENASWMLDLRILLGTFRAVVAGLR